MFSYKVKQPAPPAPVFVKVVEIIQKKSDFPVFYSMVYSPDISTLLWHSDLRGISLVKLK